MPTSKAIVRKALLAVVMAAGMAFTCTIKAQETPVKGTCMAENPVDGSVWIGSEGQGLYRLGRNGRRIKYTAKEGQIHSDSIKTLFFDAENTLWILDGKGCLTTYSSTEGFKTEEGLEKGVNSAVYDKKNETIYYSKENTVAAYKKVNRKTKKLAELESKAESLKLAENGADFIWVFTRKGVYKIGFDGKVQPWEDAPGSLNPLPYTFETNEPPMGVEGTKSSRNWAIIIWALIALCAGASAGWLLGKRSKVKIINEPPVIVPKTVLEPIQSVRNEEINQNIDKPEKIEIKANNTESTDKPATEKKEKVVQAEENKSSKGGAFTKQVTALIREHLSEPDFDVDSIAALTGISRIHVNRKLKQEGAPSPSALIKEARMKLAVRLIRQGKLGISQISTLCGFRTPSYFATAFKEYYGVSPSEFTEEN